MRCPWQRSRYKRSALRAAAAAGLGAAEVVRCVVAYCAPCGVCVRSACAAVKMRSLRFSAQAWQEVAQAVVLSAGRRGGNSGCDVWWR